MALIIEIKVVPRSKKQRCELATSGIIKCWIKNPPEAGKANTELIKLLSKKLGIPTTKISIMSGATSRKKHLKIDAKVTFEDVCKSLDIELQMKIT